MTYNGENISVGQGSYDWNSKGNKKNLTVDSYGGVLSKLLPPIAVNPNSQLHLQFDYQPDTIILNGGATEDEGKIIKDNIIITPEESGTRVYYIDCNWPEGTATYVIAVEVINK